MLAPGQLFGPFVRGKLGALENVGFQGAGQGGKHPVVWGLLLMTNSKKGVADSGVAGFGCSKPKSLKGYCNQLIKGVASCVSSSATARII